MALILATPFAFRFSVIGDNSAVTIDVDLSQEPFSLPGPIKRVTDLIVTNVAGLTATRLFTGTTISLTFSAPWIGVAMVNIGVII